MRKALFIMVVLAAIFAIYIKIMKKPDATTARTVAPTNISKPDRPATRMDELDGYIATLEKEPARVILNDLKEAAKSNGSAAAAISSALLKCLNKQIRLSYLEDQTKHELSTQKDPDKSIQDLKLKLDNLDAECAGLTKEEMLSAYDYVEIAADLGDLKTQAFYALLSRAFVDMDYALRNPQALITAKERAAFFMQRAAAAGSVDAMDQLATHYSAGTILERDLVRSTAYLLTAARYSTDPQVRRASQQRADARMTKLNPTERAEANQLSASYLDQINKNPRTGP